MAEPAAKTTVLAVDLGGTSLRAGLVDQGGRVRAVQARAHIVGAEADPWAWWHALQALMAALPAREVAGIAISGFTRSQVLVDAAGDPVRPAQCFPDGRAGAEGAEIADAVAGTWVEPNAWHPLARLLWVRRHDPRAWARARRVLQPKDWLVLRLTGREVADDVSNAWALHRDGKPAADAFRALDLDPDLLPPLTHPASRVGEAQEGPLRGVPVFAGAMDTWCATLGAGALLAGGGSIVSGTTDACGVLTRAAPAVPGLVTLPWGEGLHYVGGPSQAGADCAAWLAGVLGREVAEIGALAQAARPAPLLFLPYLSGERTPLWEPQARGAFLGLHRGDGAAEMARAVLEGVALANRDVLERAGLAADAEIRIAGGGARSDAWCRIRADMLGRVLVRARAEEPGLVGAAALAWVGLGHYAGLAAAQAAMAGDADRFAPDPAARARAEAMFAHFRRAQQAGVALSRALVADPALR